MTTPQPSPAATTFEVEMKFRVEDPAGLLARIDSLSPRHLGVEDQADSYLAHPARDFAATGEALRIRRIGPENRVTYKGPKHGGPTKTREEIEIGFDSGNEALCGLLRLWEALGFRPVATVRKRRTSFGLRDGVRTVLVVVDEAEGLGTFAEVETLAQGRDDVPAAQAAVQALAARLGLDREAYEPRSYLRMLLELESGKSSGPV